MRAPARDGAPPGGDPDGPPDDPPQPQPTTLAAEWRALLPRIVEAVQAQSPHDRFAGRLCEHLLRDAFVTARREGHWHPGRFGRLSGRLQPAVFLRLAVADGRAPDRLSRSWRAAIHKATGVIIRPKLDPRALAARARREEREKAEQAEPQPKSTPSTRRRA